MTATDSRDRAERLAKTDPQAALEVARTIGDPWFRAQALACVARFSEKREALRILREARVASEAAGDLYGVIGSSAWRLRAMIELGFAEEAANELPELIDSSLKIENPVSRLEALFLVFQAVFPLDGARHLALESLIRACQAADSWKAGDRLQESALMLAGNYPSEAEQVIRAMPEGKYKRQATRRIAASEYREPRDFFW